MMQNEIKFHLAPPFHGEAGPGVYGRSALLFLLLILCKLIAFSGDDLNQIPALFRHRAAELTFTSTEKLSEDHGVGFFFFFFFYFLSPILGLGLLYLHCQGKAHYFKPMREELLRGLHCVPYRGIIEREVQEEFGRCGKMGPRQIH